MPSNSGRGSIGAPAGRGAAPHVGSPTTCRVCSPGAGAGRRLAHVRMAAQSHGGGDLLDGAQDTVLDPDDHPVVDGLRAVEHLARTLVLDGADVGLQEHLDPLRAGPGEEDRGELLLDQLLLRGVQLHVHVHPVGAGRDLVGEADHLHQPTERALGTGVDPDELAVRALERAGDEPDGRRCPELQ